MRESEREEGKENDRGRKWEKEEKRAKMIERMTTNRHPLGYILLGMLLVFLM